MTVQLRIICDKCGDYVFTDLGQKHQSGYWEVTFEKRGHAEMKYDMCPGCAVKSHFNLGVDKKS